MPFGPVRSLRYGSLLRCRGHGLRGGHGCIRIINHVLQFLARLEIRDLFGGDFHPRAGFRIAANPGLPLARAEAPESADLDLLAGSQRANDAVENGLHDDLGFLPGHLHDPGDFFNQIGLRHRILLSSQSLTKPQYRLISPDLQARRYSALRSFRLMTSSMVVVAAAAWRW